MFVIDDVIVAAIVGAVVEALVGKALEHFKGDPEKKAFKAALRQTMQGFDRDYPGWSEQFLSKSFLKDRAAPILARAVMRDDPPTAAELADAFADHFHGGDAKVAEMATLVAADFLLLLDVALRRQPIFRPHFDSVAFDVSAIYLEQLLLQARASWAEERKDRVTDALEKFVGAAERYVAAGELVERDRSGAYEQVVDAKIGAKSAYFVLARMSYSDIARLKAAFDELVVVPYLALEDVVAAGAADTIGYLTLVQQGSEEFIELLLTAPPI